MRIGILGGGSVGGTLGKRWTELGHQVKFGVRDPKSPDMVATLADCGGKAEAAGPLEAAEFGDVVVCALPWGAVQSVMESLPLSGKIVLDATNPILPNFAGLEYGTTSSGGEKVAEWSKGAKVVKIFNSTGYNNMADPLYEGRGATMFYCGDDAGAKAVAAQLASEIGFEAVDAGALKMSRYLEPFAMLWISLAIANKNREFALQMVKR